MFDEKIIDKKTAQMLSDETYQRLPYRPIRWVCEMMVRPQRLRNYISLLRTSAHWPMLTGSHWTVFAVNKTFLTLYFMTFYIRWHIHLLCIIWEYWVYFLLYCKFFKCYKCCGGGGGALALCSSLNVCIRLKHNLFKRNIMFFVLCHILETIKSGENQKKNPNKFLLMNIHLVSEQSKILF